MLDFLVDIEQFMLFEQRASRMVDAFAAVPKAAAKVLRHRILAEAKESLGKYQGSVGPYPGWANLSQATIERRERLGINPANEPLLETEAGLKCIQASEEVDTGASIDFTIGYVAGQATHSQSGKDAAHYMMVHEIGSPAHRIPPRPVIGPAVMRVAEDMSEILQPIIFNHFNALGGPGGMSVIDAVDKTALD